MTVQGRGVSMVLTRAGSMCVRVCASQKSLALMVERLEGIHFDVSHVGLANVESFQQPFVSTSYKALQAKLIKNLAVMQAKKMVLHLT